MENKPRKSKALIITIIVILFLIVTCYLIFKNRDMFGVKTSNTIAKIFSPLTTSENEKNIKKIDENSIRTLAQAGEDLKKGDNVSKFGVNADNNPIVIKSKTGDEIFGFAGSDIGSGDLGEIITSNSGSNSFWDSFSSFLNNLFNNNQTQIPQPSGGWIYNNVTGQWEFDPNGTGGWIFDPNTGTWLPPNGGNGGGGNGGGGDFAGQCSDTLDNDNDNLIDESDPQCHVDGDLTKAYVPDHYSEATFPGGGGGGDYIKQCSDTLDNDNDNLIDTLDPGCHTDGDATNTNSYNPDDYSEVNGGGGNENGTPDLTASSVTPATASINIPVNLTTIITNNGDGSTKFNFTSFFNIIKESDIDFENGDDTTVSKINIKNLFVKILNKISFIKKAVALTGNTNTTTNGIELSVVVPVLRAETSNVTTVSYTFTSPGVYKIRACADKRSSSDVGNIEESNEENNCGDWTTLTASGSLPQPDDDITPPDDDITPPEPSEEIVTPENKCLLIEQNPLVFTDTEKAKLAEFLRKFYLIASTLKTEEDIVTVYSEIDQYKNFIAQTDGLIDSCYKEVASAKAKSDVAASWVQNGNPWYRKETAGWASFGGNSTYTNYNLLEGNYSYNEITGAYTGLRNPSGNGPGCKVISGYYYGKLVKDAYLPTPTGYPIVGNEGDDCNKFNPEIFNCYGINSNLYGNSGGGPDQNLLNAGCKWKEGVYLDGVEKVLEMW